jgi:hypothetical protein
MAVDGYPLAGGQPRRWLARKIQFEEIAGGVVLQQELETGEPAIRLIDVDDLQFAGHHHGAALGPTLGLRIHIGQHKWNYYHRSGQVTSQCIFKHDVDFPSVFNGHSPK